MANENGSGGPTDDINEEIRKAKEVARSLAGKEVSSVWFQLFLFRMCGNSTGLCLPIWERKSADF